MSKTILTNFTNFDKFVQFLKIWVEGSFWKNLRKFKQKFHILVHLYFDIYMHNYVQRSFTSLACPGTHTGFLRHWWGCQSFDFPVMPLLLFSAIFDRRLTDGYEWWSKSMIESAYIGIYILPIGDLFLSFNAVIDRRLFRRQKLLRQRI